MTVILVSGLMKERKNLYTLNPEKVVLTMGSTSQTRQVVGAVTCEVAPSNQRRIILKIVLYVKWF